MILLVHLCLHSMYINNRQLGLKSLTNVIPSKEKPSVSCILEVTKLPTASVTSVLSAPLASSVAIITFCSKLCYAKLRAVE